MNKDPVSALAHSVRSSDPAAALVLCLHGQGGRVAEWTDRVRDVAAHGVEALAIEIPLHGARRVDNVDPGGSLTMIDYLRLVDVAADEVCDLVASLGRRRAVGLLGHSLGAEIALVAMSRNRHISAVAAIGTVVSDPTWASPTSPWQGGDTAEFARVLTRVTLLDRPHLLAPRRVAYFHGIDDVDAPLNELLHLLDRTGHRDRLTMLSGRHDLTSVAIESASNFLASSLTTTAPE